MELPIKHCKFCNTQLLYVVGMGVVNYIKRKFCNKACQMQWQASERQRLNKPHAQNEKSAYSRWYQEEARHHAKRREYDRKWMQEWRQLRSLHEVLREGESNATPTLYL